MKAKFKVGDKVKITNNNRVYSTYKNSFILNSVSNKLFKMFESGYVPHNNTFADVVAVGKHEWGHNIYFIKENGHVSIIGESGIELVESTDKIAINRYGNKVVAKMGKKVGVAKYNETDTFDLYTGVKIAVDRLFGKDNEVKEVKRQAKVGEYIKIINSKHSYRQYKDGDVFEVIESINKNGDVPEYVFVKEFKNPCILASEYVVLKNYKPQEVKEEKPKYYNGKVVCVDNRIDDNNFKKGRIYEVVNGTVNGFPMFNKKLTDFKDLQYYFYLSGNYSAYEVKFIELVEDK